MMDNITSLSSYHIDSNDDDPKTRLYTPLASVRGPDDIRSPSGDRSRSTAMLFRDVTTAGQGESLVLVSVVGM